MISAGNQYQSTIDAPREEVHPSAVRSRDERIALGALVTIVDDDESVRESLPDLITEFGFAAARILVGERVSFIQLCR